MNVRVRYWAAVRAAALCKEESLDESATLTIENLIHLLIANHGSADFARILNGCSVLVDGRAVARSARDATFLEDGQTVEFLPPFAGG